MQHSKCCVVSQPPWVQIPALPPLPPGPIGAGRFCYACLTSCVAVLPHGCFGRRRARPPARLGDLTSFGAAPRSPPVPSGPSGALHTGGAGSLMCALRVDSLSGQAPPLPINFARNSPAACSNIECASLELQRFWGVSKNDHDKLRATFGQCGLCCRLRVLGSDSPAIPALVIPEAVGVLHYTKPAGGVSPACRALV